MKYKDYYDILGVSRDASTDEITKAYRKLARKYHPDVSKEADAQQRFQDVGEAYEVLKDKDKRKAYDRLGANWKAGQDFQPPPGWDFQGDMGDLGGMGGVSDFFSSLFGGSGGFSANFGGRGGGFEELFGGRRGGRGRGKGQDIEAQLDINLEDSYAGSERTITLSADSQFNQGRSLKVKIPKGVLPGQRIRLSGQGNPGPAAPGDLFLEIQFRPHKHYRVEGKDVYLNLPIAPWEAALGGKIEVPTPSGTIGLNIPAGSQSGRKLRLKGRGIPAKQPGDLYVVLQVHVPEAESDEAKALFEEMRDKLDFNPRAGLGV